MTTERGQDYIISVSIDVKDLEKLAKLLNAQPAFKAGVQMGAAEVHDYIADYPPLTYGNLPGPYPKRWVTADQEQPHNSSV